MLKKASDVVPTIQSLIGNSRRYTDMKAATAGMTMPDSSDQIIREITALLPASSKVPEPVIVPASA